MQVSLITCEQELSRYVDAWQALTADHPMRSPAWLLTWWDVRCAAWSAADERLFVLIVTDDQQRLVGLAPWYQSTTAFEGVTLRFLGTGRTCSDHLSLVHAPGMGATTAECIARWLASPRGRRLWNTLRLEAIDAHDDGIEHFINLLRAAGMRVDLRGTSGLWQVDLPPTWEEYLSQVSKNHRKRCRRWERDLLSGGRAQVHVVGSTVELAKGFDVLVDLHSRRRRTLGDHGLFADPEQFQFHRRALERLHAAAQLRLSWLEIDGQPAACEYQLVGGRTVHAYQSGVAPEFFDLGAGNVSVLASIKFAIESGYSRFDFMRGDEEYKAHWGAYRVSAQNFIVHSMGFEGNLRHIAWRTGSLGRQWLKTLVNARATAVKPLDSSSVP